MKTNTPILLFLCLTLIFTSCVGKKKYTQMLAYNEKIQLNFDEAKKQLEECKSETLTYRDDLRETQANLRVAEKEVDSKNGQIDQLKNDIGYLKTTNENLFDRLSDLSIVSKTGAESIKESLKSINEQNKYIKDLTDDAQRKDSINLALVMNLKRSLGDINDQDIQIEVRGGVVYVSIADKLLFTSGSSEISPRAEVVLSKVAKVLNDHSGLDIMVEGHTDSVPIKNSCVTDNWDLSVKRATAVVRYLQWKHNVAPTRLTAAGRSEYAPKDVNETAAGRTANRRTEIVITPKLDQFFKLMEKPVGE